MNESGPLGESVTDKPEGGGDEAYADQKPPPIAESPDAEEPAPPVARIKTADANDSRIHEENRKEELRPQREPMKLDAKLMVALTAIIAVATAANVWVFWYESEDTSKKTDRQIAALSKQMSATAALALEAKNQTDNTRILAGAASDQVGKLQAGVEETHRLAKATQDVLDLQRRAQRPWIGIPGGIITVGPQSFAVTANSALIGVFIYDVHFDLQNFGAAPAVKSFVSVDVWLPPTSGVIVSSVNPPDSAYDAVCRRADFATEPKQQPASAQILADQQQSLSLMPTERRPINKQTVAGSTESYTAGAIDTLWLVGCITYTETASGVRHHTVFQAESMRDATVPLKDVGNKLRRFFAPQFKTFEVVVEAQRDEQAN